MDKFPLQIKGAKPTSNFLQVKSPYDGALVGEVERADRAALEQALNNCVSAFELLNSSFPTFKRAEILYKVSEKIKAAHEELALTIASEGGKPLKDARIEVTRAANTTKLCADEALSLNGEELRMDRAAGSENHLAWTMRLPLGPVLAISAFNHPLNLACHQVCTAFAAGNPVIFKPASQTPLCGLKLAKFFEEAGLPGGIINVAVCSGSEAEYLVQDARIRFVTFIGSEAVGWEIPKKIHHGVRYSLEHGGSATSLVLNDAPLERVIPALTRGAFYHSGQVCVSTQIVYAQKECFQKLVDGLLSAAQKLKVGDACDPNTDLGPIISRTELERIHAALNQAEKLGAKILCGGKPSGSCYPPTIVTNTTCEMDLVKHEIFGPVLVVEPFSDLEQTIRMMNFSKYSFQNSIFTNDINLALSAAKKVECKGFMINDSTAFRVDWMPFGGSKASGFGVGGVRNSIIDMTEEKLVVAKIQA